MIAHKIKSSTNHFRNKDFENVLSEVVANPICNEYFKRFFIDRSLGRPRDLVKFFSLVSEDYGEYMSRFESDLFVRVLPTYSGYLKREITSELAGHLDKNTIDAMFTMLRRNVRRRFNYEKIKSVFEMCKFEDTSYNLDNFLSNLFDVGAIGNITERPKFDGGDIYTWSYLSHDAVVNFDASFEIHPGLWDALSIQKPKNRW
ncbi:hypothetical protein CS022_04535 [Veronia nyctiphanis]|uniref:Uncharacterized protein n=1 Tax=Veronia nyctiphanis TaxID=1278244 RepID=A0A4Q0YSW7_9GAMM|nr:hypothetical protein [Veronia nyctiphanis]RXJ74322.1 hypothetical protein CS022_04535 [Veronia nyctiphanis]